MGEKRTLIETFLPVEEISQEAKNEKKGNARPPRSLMHYWWTRKPLIASRAAILGALLPEDYDINEYKKLLYLGKKGSHKYNLTKTQLNGLKKSYKEMWGTDTPTILDPFAGGGSIPFEALRVGCNVIANDYNPVANLILRGSLEYPLKYREKFLEDVKTGFEWIFEKSKDELQNLYPQHDGKDVAAYIYAWVVSCPDCGFKSPLVGQWWLTKRKRKLYLDYKKSNEKLKFCIKEGEKAPEKNMSGKTGKCLSCGKTIPGDHIKKEIYEKEEEILLAVVLLKKGGKVYDLPNKNDLIAIEQSNDILKEKWDELIKDDLIPLEEMPDDLRGGIWSKVYLKYWYRILNPRQRLLFATLIKLIRDYLDELDANDDYKRALGTCLSFLLAKHVDYNSRSTIWHRNNDQISHVLTNKGIPMMWDHAEVNPFVKSSGTLQGMIKDILNGLDYSMKKFNDKSSIVVKNDSITELDVKVPVIVTDPPYFDDVQYAELSEFFYVFEKRALKNLIKLPSETPKSEDLSVGGKRKPEVFKHLFEIACHRMHSILEENGILVMFFAHSSIEAWDFVVESLRKSNFIITATWPVHTENPNSPAARDKAAILSSILIVARKRKEDKEGYYEEIKTEAEPILKERINKFWDYGLRGADLTVAAMGTTLDILTPYSEMKSMTGEKKVNDILELAEDYVVNYILNKYLSNPESLDPATRFYIYCRLSELDEMPFDTANLISKSLNLDLSPLENAGLIKKVTINKKKWIKLLSFEERESFESRSLIDIVQASMAAYEKSGMKEFESLVNDSPHSQKDIMNIISVFQHLEESTLEKQIALQILGKSADLIPEKGQTTFD